ncbi:MAG: RDD family protein [Gammaproteobacteria bacterium]|nr:RDD family protein [Gammaproteobacteria bacterium]
MNTQTIKYAGFWRRLGATFTDALLVVTLTAPLQYLIYGHDYFRWLIRNIDLFNAYGVWDAIITRIIPLLVIVALWHLMGSTPGKRLFHCKIVDAATLGPLSWRQCFTRLFTYAASILPFYLGFLWIGWDKHKQGFHDKLAHTLVLHSPDDYGTESLSDLMATNT